MNCRSKKNVFWNNKNVFWYIYKINVIGLVENKILMNIVLWGKCLYYIVFKLFEGRILLDLLLRMLFNLVVVFRMVKCVLYFVYMVFVFGYFLVFL